MANILKKNGYDSEEAYFHKRDQELIAQKKEKDRSHLKLLQGGKSQQMLQLPEPKSQTMRKAG